MTDYRSNIRRPRTPRPPASWHLLVDERKTIAFLPSLARLLGERRAIVLQQLHYITERGDRDCVVRGGLRWVAKSYAAWCRDEFPWINQNSLRGVFYDLGRRGLVDAAPEIGPANETGYRVNHEALLALYDEDPDAGSEPYQDLEEGGCAIQSPPEHTTPGGRALCAGGGAQIEHPPLRNLSTPGRAHLSPPLINARAPTTKEERVLERVEEEETDHPSAAAQARAATAIAPAAADEPVDPLRGGQLTAEQAAAAQLLDAAKFTPAEITDLARRFTLEQIRTAVDKTRRKAEAGKLRNPRAYILGCLNRGDRPEPSAGDLARGLSGDRVAREKQASTSAQQSATHSLQVVSAELAAAARSVESLEPEAFNALLAQTIDDNPILAGLVRRHGPRGSLSVLQAMSAALAAGWSIDTSRQRPDPPGKAGPAPPPTLSPRAASPFTGSGLRSAGVVMSVSDSVPIGIVDTSQTPPGVAPGVDGRGSIEFVATPPATGRCRKCGAWLCPSCATNHACGPSALARGAERFSLSTSPATRAWSRAVVLCGTFQPGVWRIEGRIAGEAGPTHTLARSSDLAALRQELVDRGYQLTEGCIDPHCGIGMEIYQREQGGQQ